MEHTYTVKQLDALRKAIQSRMLTEIYGTCGGGWAGGAPIPRGLEERVRTHMLAGHTADDIYKENEPNAGSQRTRHLVSETPQAEATTQDGRPGSL